MSLRVSRPNCRRSSEDRGKLAHIAAEIRIQLRRLEIERKRRQLIGEHVRLEKRSPEKWALVSGVTTVIGAPAELLAALCKIPNPECPFDQYRRAINKTQLEIESN